MRYVKASFILAGAAVVMLSSSKMEATGCANKRNPAVSGGPVSIKVDSTGFPNSPAVTNARAVWNNANCGVDGPGFDYPILGTTGEPNALIDVRFNSGHATSKDCTEGGVPSYCLATTYGALITIYKFSGPNGTNLTPGVSGSPTSGETTELTEIIAHEFGHALGLAHDNCPNGYMNAGDSFPVFPAVHSDECQGVDRQNTLPGEGFDNGAGCPWVSGCTVSPIVFSVDGGSYDLTSLQGGVQFDIDASGDVGRVAWTLAGRQLAFLARDLDGNGLITDGRELFGEATVLADAFLAANGWEALIAFDSNHDNKIDAGDALWADLLLWTDLNHDGVSQGSELVAIQSSPVLSISLDYHRSGLTDQFGNEFRYRSKARIARGGVVRDQAVYDIYFVTN